MTDSAIHASAIHKTYRSGRVLNHVLRGLNLAIPRGQFVAIMGPSGCGKSTLLHVLGMMLRADRGALTLAGARVDGLGQRALTELRRKTVGFVFQRFNLLTSLTALDNLKLAARVRGGDARRQPGELLDRVGLGWAAKRRPGRLSVGEQQRVALARALIGAPPILLADEPTGNLDSQSADKVLKLMRELHDERGQTTVMITHSATAAAVADVVLTMKDGLIETRNAECGVTGFGESNTCTEALRG